MGRFLLVLLGTAAILPVPAMAQSGGAITIYARGGFNGLSMTYSEATQHINPAFTAKSVRISGEAAWELCSGNTYSGCRRIDKSDAGRVFIVRSVRPVAPVIVARVSAPNQSLRGVASEFFVAPNRGGDRVGVSGNNPEGMRKAADDFCRSAGWQMSAHARVQNDGGSYYLIDVLCTNKE